MVAPRGRSADRKAGTVTDEGLTGALTEAMERTVGAGMKEQTNVFKDLSFTLESMRKSATEDRTGTQGTFSSLGQEERQLVFLARGCDTFQVELVPAEEGKELFRGIKHAGEIALHLL